MLSKNSPFTLREESGLSVKSSIKHITTVDTRDNKILANEGIFFQMVMEIAGFGGDVKFLRNHFISQFYTKISRDVVCIVYKQISICFIMPCLSLCRFFKVHLVQGF